MITIENTKALPSPLVGKWVSVKERVPRRAGIYIVRRIDCEPFMAEFHAERFMVFVVDFWFEIEEQQLDPEERALSRMVDAYAAAMKEKLLRKKRRDGYSGWDRKQNMEGIAGALIEHLPKGDYVDVGNLAAFLWNFDQP